jgi:ribosomal protein S18 acetylase RimI-like enzyme
MEFIVRNATFDDANEIFNLYKLVTKSKGGIAREEDEITLEYTEYFIGKSIKNGICLVITDSENEILGEVHCFNLSPRVFRHVLSELTIVIHPSFQNRGLGRLLFSKFLEIIENSMDDILRVELIARESNAKAIKLYQELGFVQEGRFEKRIDNNTQQFEADIPMAWFNKNYKNKV